MATTARLLYLSPDGLIRQLGFDPDAPDFGGDGSSTPASKLGVFPGVTSSLTGTIRYYPETDRTVTGLTLWASSAVPTDTTVTLRKNGVAVGTCTVLSGQTTATVTTLAEELLTTDYLTVDLSSSGAMDVVTRIDF